MTMGPDALRKSKHRQESMASNSLPCCVDQGCLLFTLLCRCAACLKRHGLVRSTE